MLRIVNTRVKGSLPCKDRDFLLYAAKKCLIFLY